MHNYPSPSTEVADIPEPDTVPIESLDEFVRALVGWHKTQVERIQHLIEVPEGSVFSVGDDDVTEIVMTPEVRTGFKFGIEMTMMHLGALPFKIELEEDEKDAQV